MSNRAAYITEAKANPLQVKDAPLPSAGKGEVVVRNYAAAINPIDWKIQDFGIFLKSYPNVLGNDIAGEVHEVGEGVTNVKKGDRVLGHAFSLVSSIPAQGGFQLYTVLNALVVSKIPDSVSYNSAAVLPLAISTAAALLFKKETLALPLPTSSDYTPPSNDKSVLVWGGSSSVGATAIQLAVDLGYKVVSVASKHNIESVKALGAVAVFDYKSPSVAEDIIAALEGSDYTGVADAIGTSAAVMAWAPVYKKLGGRYGTVLNAAKELPEGIEGGGVLGPTVALADKYVGDFVWAKWVPEALQKGTLKALPEPTVIKGGLESVQEGINKQRAGVSFSKIVVEL